MIERKNMLQWIFWISSVSIILVLRVLPECTAPVVDFPTVPIVNHNITIESSDGAHGSRTVRTMSLIEHDLQSFDSNVSTPSFIAESYVGPQTTFTPWPLNRSFPCFEELAPYNLIKVQRSPSKRGILFTREMKTGSSTMASVLARIAYEKGKALLPSGGICKHRLDHSSARSMKYKERSRAQSFHLSLLRHPTKRIISHFFHFPVSAGRTVPTDSNFMDFINGDGKRWSNYYAKDLTLTPIKERLQDEEEHQGIVQDILEAYDFIAITERLDESLVVLKNLLHLELADVVYMSAKVAGNFDASKPKECVYIIPSFLTPRMKSYFESDSFTKDYMGVDNILYRAAHVSLDNTIESLGRSKIEKEVETLRSLVMAARESCLNETRYRCDEGGNFIGMNASNCLLWGLGCGYECLERFGKSNYAQSIVT